MIDAADPADADRLHELVCREPFVRQLVVLGRVDSTNDEARRLAALGAPAGTVVVADQQTAGRGRHGRPWFSAPRLGLYVTVLLRPTGAVERLPRWTLAAAVAACEACRELSAADVTIKWPNDLMCDGRKLGGVLAEARHTALGPTELIVGTGINVGHRTGEFPEDLASTATSLCILAAGAPVDRIQLAAVYMRQFALLAQAIEADAWDEVAQRFEGLAPGTRDRRVRIEHSGVASFEGLTAGIDSRGALNVQRSDGTVVPVHALDSVLPLEN